MNLSNMERLALFILVLIVIGTVIFLFVLFGPLALLVLPFLIAGGVGGWVSEGNRQKNNHRNR